MVYFLELEASPNALCFQFRMIFPLSSPSEMADALKFVKSQIGVIEALVPAAKELIGLSSA